MHVRRRRIRGAIFLFTRNYFDKNVASLPVDLTSHVPYSQLIIMEKRRWNFAAMLYIIANTRLRNIRIIINHEFNIALQATLTVEKFSQVRRLIILYSPIIFEATSLGSQEFSFTNTEYLRGLCDFNIISLTSIAWTSLRNPTPFSPRRRRRNWSDGCSYRLAFHPRSPSAADRFRNNPVIDPLRTYCGTASAVYPHIVITNVCSRQQELHKSPAERIPRRRDLGLLGDMR